MPAPTFARAGSGGPPRLCCHCPPTITAQIAADPDTSPAWTDVDFASAKWVLPWPRAEDIRALRKRLGLSQAGFAARYGFSVETIRNYEQGHRHPTGPARVLLRVIASEPEAVERALAG